MKEKIYKKIASLLTRHWYLPLIIISVLTAFCYPKTVDLFKNISTDLIKLLPGHYQSVQTLEKIRVKFEGGSSLAMVLESENPEKTKEALLYLAGELSKDKQISFVHYKKTGYNFFDKHKLLFLDLEDLETIRDRIDRRIQKEKLGGFYIDFEDSGSEEDDFKFGDLETKYKTRYTAGARNEFLTDEDGKIFTVAVVPADKSETLKTFDSFYTYIRGKVEVLNLKRFDPTLEIHYAGTIRGRLDEYKTLTKDLTIAGLISGIGIFLLLAIYFKRPLAAIIIFAPLGAGIICSFAFAHLFIKNLNVVTSFLFAVLGGLGVEIGIHMFARYAEERVAGHNVEDSVFKILYHTGRSAITSGITVASTFLILMVNDFKGFSEFGFITGTGIIIIYCIYHLAFPSLLVAAEKIRLLRFKKVEDVHKSYAEKSFPYASKILIATIVLSVLSAAAMPFIKFEYNFANLKSNIKESKIAKEKLRKTTATVNRPALVLIKDLDEALAIKEYVNEKIAADEKANTKPILDTFKSWYDITQYNQDEKMSAIGDMKKLLADKTIKLVKGEHKKDLDKFKDILNETVPIKEQEIPQEVKDIFFGTKDDGYHLGYINAEPHLELDDGRNAIEFKNRIGMIKTPKGTFHASSDAIIFADVLQTMLKDVPRVILFSFFMVFLFVYLDFRNFRKAAIVMSPIVLGLVLMFGIMLVFRMKLNFYNMIIVPTVFGTSIDNSIHIYHRYEEMGKKNLLRVLRTSGGAALMSSLTNIFGFLGLVAANHNGLSSIGTLAIAGMSACLFTTLVYFPATLQWLADRKKPPYTPGV